jgi:hypothetical protein
MRRAKRYRFPRLNGVVPTMHRHFAVGPASLSHPVVSSLLDDRHGRLAVFCVRPLTGRPPIVEIIADLTASKNFSGHQLRTHVSLLTTQEKLV